MIKENMFEDYPDVLTVKDLQSALGIGENASYKLIHSGQLQHMKIGRKIKIPKRCLIDFVVNSCYNDDTAMSELTCHKEVTL